MIEFIVKVSIALVIFYAFYRAFLAKESMFRFNRFFLIFALSFSLIVPFIQMPFGVQISENIFSEQTAALPSVEKERSQTEINAQPVTLDQEENEVHFQPPTVNTLNWNAIVLGIYLLGFIFFSIRFSFQLAQLIRLVRNNPTLKDNECTYVMLTDQTIPYTFLNYLFVEKESFQKNTIEKEILCHELTHIRQKHSWDILLVEFLKIVFWFNPLYLLYKQAVQLNHEFLADEAVNATFREKATYQWLLLNKTTGTQVSLSMSSPFNFSATKSRIIMMGKFSSPLKTNLLKSVSILIAAFLTVFLSSSQQFESTSFQSTPFQSTPFQSTPFQSSNEFEKLLSEGFKDGDQYELDLNKLDLYALREAYLALDENEKFTGTEFPFFDELAFDKMVELQQAYPEVKTSILYERSPEKKEIKKEVFEQWKKTKNISLTIDDIEKEVSELKNYQPEDFAMFLVRETEKKGFLKKAAYNVSLMTHEYFHGKFFKAVKKIERVQAEYPSSHKVQVGYRRNNIVEIDGKITKTVPENFEATIFHQLRIVDPAELIASMRNSMQDNRHPSLIIAILSNEGRGVTVMRLPIK
ncbi:M56 family metallopeptidase [Lunatibacter salilacus]|uniref:M56 family metallopeptidase n=1 Tax=Lunatibacter salilacus TaxID=2483804 RepID=UPI00131CD4B8|nr:M56 family metallopeptidase [Lunatibacter salilacus]